MVKKRRFGFSIVAGVGAVLGHLREPVEQRLARHPHAVEPQPAVVDAVEAELEAVVLDPYAGRRRPGLVADRHHEGVHARGPRPPTSRAGRTRPPPGRAGRRCRCSPCGPPSPWVVITNSPVPGVVRRHRAEGLHVAAVPGLGHREAAHQLPGHQVAQVGVVVALGAELEDRAAEQPELHAHLHQHRQVAVREGLERRDRRAEVAAAAVLLREAHPRLAGRGHLEHQVADPVAVVLVRQRLGLLEDRRRTPRGCGEPGRAPRRTSRRAGLPSAATSTSGAAAGGLGSGLGGRDGWDRLVAMQFTLPGQVGADAW